MKQATFKNTYFVTPAAYRLDNRLLLVVEYEFFLA